ncbi:MAG: putative ABC transport system ATP-binding protein [Polaribacter sp.]|jgi:putative ABC transport system ATP-binding protein
MITLKELTKVYRTDEIETAALNEVSLHISKGEFVSIMGPSGCGKSTLLNMLGMLDTAESGSYQFFDQEITNLKKKERSKVRTKHIGFIFQNFNLIDELTVFENVELPLIYARIPQKKRKESVDLILERIGIAHRAEHFPQQLSGGQQQRVAVARALVNKPDLILADEPTGNLDSSNGNEVMELLCELNESGTTIVMVTHSPHDASYSNRIVNLLDGQIISERKTISDEKVTDVVER